MAVKFLEIIKEISMIDKEKAAVFYESEDGLLILRFLLERLANKGGVSGSMFSVVKQILDIVLKHYPSSKEKYIEMIFLNMDIWKHSPQEVQEQIALHVHNMFIVGQNKQFDIPKIVDILLNCIEIYVNQEQIKTVRIKQLLNIILQLSFQHVTKEVLIVIISYANIFFLRRLRNYPLQIYYVLSLYLEIFTACTFYK